MCLVVACHSIARGSYDVSDLYDSTFNICLVSNASYCRNETAADGINDSLLWYRLVIEKVLYNSLRNCWVHDYFADSRLKGIVFLLNTKLRPWVMFPVSFW